MISSLIAASKKETWKNFQREGGSHYITIPVLFLRDIALFAGLALLLYLEYKGTLEIVADEAVFDIMQLQSFLYGVLFVLSIPLFSGLTFACETAFKDVRKRVIPEMPIAGIDWHRVPGKTFLLVMNFSEKYFSMFP